MLRKLSILAAICWSFGLGAAPAEAQETSVRPGVNDSFRDPNVEEYVDRFEIESREVFAKRKEIVAACDIKPGQTVADVGAGTGLFTRLFSDAVGKEGKVIAVDISQKFLDHIALESREAGRKNVETLLCKADSTELPADSIDLAFICDTYHHFEFPHKTMSSLHRALKPGGRVVLIDFRRVAGASTDWVMNHVRAGQEVFEAEIAAAGFVKEREIKDVLKENYLVVFSKASASASAAPLGYPIIAGYGGVVARPDAAEQPRRGAKILLDVTADAGPNEVHKALASAARLLNLYGAAGLKADDVKIALAFHGPAVKAILNDEAYHARHGEEKNPNSPLLSALKAAGVEIFVCSQALATKKIADSEVSAHIVVAASALTVIMNKQQDGYAYVLIP